MYFDNLSFANQRLYDVNGCYKFETKDSRLHALGLMSDELSREALSIVHHSPDQMLVSRFGELDEDI